MTLGRLMDDACETIQSCDKRGPSLAESIRKITNAITKRRL